MYKPKSDTFKVIEIGIEITDGNQTSIEYLTTTNTVYFANN